MFSHCYGQYYIIHEQYLPSVSGLLGIIKSTGFPKYRTLNMKLEEAYLLLFIVMMTSNLTASAPKRKLKIKVTLLLWQQQKEGALIWNLLACSQCSEMRWDAITDNAMVVRGSWPWSGVPRNHLDARERQPGLLALGWAGWSSTQKRFAAWQPEQPKFIKWENKWSRPLALQSIWSWWLQGRQQGKPI